ncbi:CLUMA_CG010556, isoform A [Clunio marinus]|uniref:CLUMA_CG010556, isoform A n=1 Tax=Clunio marinus TaxID=568069 RepID=A0A1J1IA49_9DIPT|nr:CLUMA_CG010556, isoform A [Clunio marinus]
MSYFTKLIRVPSHNFDVPREKQRSRSLDVEALERTGIKMLRVRAAQQHQQQLAAQTICKHILAISKLTKALGRNT